MLRVIRILMICVIVALVIELLGGCARTVLVPQGHPIRVGPNATKRIYTLIDGTWTLSNSSVSVPEGWYIVSPDFVEASE
jgi:hypothetical protein